MADQIRVLRVVEYVGERSEVEQQIAQSLHGAKLVRQGTVKIMAVTLSEFPEVVDPPIKLEGLNVGY